MFNLGSAVGFLVLNAQRVGRGVNAAIGHINRLGAATAGTFGQMQDAYRQNFFAARDFGMVMGGAAALITAGFVKSASAAIQWEKAMAGVTRTSGDFEDGQLKNAAAIEQLESDIRKLAVSKPLPALEFAKIAEDAGALGIATDEIAKFTSVVADIATTTDLTSEEGATGLARIAKIMGNTTEEFENMGSAVLELGRSTASTEGEIVAMSRRIAGAGKAVGLATHEVFSYAAALASVGVREEQGGSAISRTFFDIRDAISTSSDELEIFATTAGLEIQEFSELFKNDAAQATNKFIFGLGKMSEAGIDINQVLRQLGITEIRQRDAILRLAAAGGFLTEVLEIGNRAWQENTALTEIANRINNTAAGQIGVLKNQLHEAAIIVGDQLVPAIKFGIRMIQYFVAGFNAMPKPLVAIISLIGAFAGAVFALAAAFIFLIPRIRAAITTLQEYMATSAAAAAAGYALQVSLGVIGVAMLAVGAIIATYGYKAAKAADEVDRLKAATEGAAEGVKTLRDEGNSDPLRQWAAAEIRAQGLKGALDEAGVTMGEVTSALANLGQDDNFEWANVLSRIRQSLPTDETGKLNEESQKLYDTFTNLAQGVQQASAAYQDNIDDLHSMGMATDAEIAAIEAFVEGNNEAAEAQEARAQAAIDLVEALRAQEDAERGVTKAQKEVAEAAENLANKSKYLADAQAQLQLAALGVGAAQRQLQDALIELSRAQAAQERAVIDAQLALADSYDQYIQSIWAVEDAEEALKELREGPSVKELTEANNKLRDSYNSLQRAILGVEDAEWQLQYLMEEGAGARDIKDAQLDLAEAQAAQANALQDHADAQEELNDLNTIDPRELAEAEMALNAARRASTQALWAYRDAQVAYDDAVRQQADNRLVLDAQYAVAQAQAGVTGAVIQTLTAQQALNDLRNGSLEDAYTDAVAGLEDALYRQAQANVEVQKQTTLMNGGTWTAIDSAQALAGELDKLGAFMTGPMAQKFKRYHDMLVAATPEERVTKIEWDTSGADRARQEQARLNEEAMDEQASLWETFWGWFSDNWWRVIMAALGPGGWLLLAITDVLKGGGGGNIGGGPDTPIVPWAKGGFVTKPTYSLIGEAGPELILPLSDMTRTMALLKEAGLHSYTKAMSSGTLTAIRAQSNLNGGVRMLEWHGSYPGTNVEGDKITVFAAPGQTPAQVANEIMWKKRASRGVRR